MSAIFGIVSKDGRPIDASLRSAMQQALMHRAADGADSWLGDYAFLGHHKLAVYPAQQKEALPFTDGDLVITADARIDNRDQLTTELKPAIAGDSALILAAYRKWDKACVDHLEGEFAFAVWNKHSGKLFCAVDHIGFRPLYYYDAPGVFIFSSEMKGILAVKDTPNTFNEEALIEYFFRHSDQSRTYNSDIYALCGGHTLIYESGKTTVTRYWSPQPLHKYHFKSDDDWAACLRELLFKAVDKRLLTDAPVGITLSGGLDSSSIACIAGRLLQQKNKPLYAFSSVLPEGYKGVETDERPYINIVGKHLSNLQQVYVEAPGAGPFNGLEETFALEETIPNLFFYMDQALHKAAQDKGVRVLLSGFGGDLFVSHKGGQVIYQLLQQNQFGDALKIFLQARSHEGSLLQVLKTDYIAFTQFYQAYVAARKGGRLNWQSYTPLRDNFSGKYTSAIDFRPVKDQAAWMTQYIGSGQAGRLMGTFANRFAAYDMEAATPMLDKDIMEFMLDVPVRQHRLGGIRRSLLRRAMTGVLPPELQARQDKLPYSPDYISRIINDRPFIEDLVRKPDLTAWQYIDHHRIAGHIGSLKPAAGMGDPKEIAAIRLAQGVICACFIEWLKKMNIDLFDKYVNGRN